MQENSLPTLGELEVRVLHQVWQDQPCTERHLWERLSQERPLGRTTVLKTLQRLEQKNVLERVPGEGPVRFRACVERRRLLPALVRRFVGQILGGAHDPLVAYLADVDELSPQEQDVLRRLLQRVESKPATRPKRKGPKS